MNILPDCSDSISSRVLHVSVPYGDFQIRALRTSVRETSDNLLVLKLYYSMSSFLPARVYEFTWEIGRDYL